MLSFVSFSLRYGFDMDNYAALIQFLLAIVLFTLMYRQHIFYAAIAMTLSYIMYGLIQVGLILSLDFFGIIAISDVQREFSVAGKQIQLISVIAAMVIVYLVKRYNKGFSFLPHTNRVTLKWTLVNASILFLIIISTGLIGFATYYFNISNHSGNYFIIFLTVISLIYLLYLYRKKDKAL
jgi:signal transduction histidine kinase